MATPIQFDSSKQFQLDAIAAVVDLLDGQILAPTQFEVPTASQAALTTEYGVGNAVDLELSSVEANLRLIQARGTIPEAMRLPTTETLLDLDFTIEMETGTGKTYVYLRTALELHKRYGITKFVVVVPSVAIREGVVANLRLARKHFEHLFDGAAYESRVYSGDNPAELRAFASSNKMQILVMNIDSFNKSSNVIYQIRDGWGPVAPIRQIQATQPVVILDEPQNLEGDAAVQAVAQLNPMMRLRYSATHRSMPNPVYRLTPVDAFNLGEVKRIDVWSVSEDESLNDAFVELVSVSSTSRKITANLRIDVTANGNTRRKVVKATANREGVLPSLYDLSGERAEYESFQLEDVVLDPPEVTFSNGLIVTPDLQIGVDNDALQRTIISTAIENQLNDELRFKKMVDEGTLPGQVKPLALFFIDHVANYNPEDGKFKLWFIEEYERLAAKSKYKALKLPPVDEVHSGYFAEDRNGPKDSSGRTKADDQAYELIMQKKDVLMDPAQPVRFIWSHSALREGWDNPNVFVIATLNETRSPVKKRQEIGRGLRLPVITSTGEQCRDPEVARLTIVANESYDSFAASLQREIEEETSTEFARSNVRNKRAGREVKLKPGAKLHPAFLELWQRIARRTSFEVDFDTDKVIERAAKLIEESHSVIAPMLRVASAEIMLDAEAGVYANLVSQRHPKKARGGFPIPDLLGHLVNELPLSRGTIAQILVKSGKLGEATTNPQRFIDLVRGQIQHALAEEMVNGVEYSPIPGTDGEYALSLLDERVATCFSETALRLDRSAFDEVVYESEVEKRFAEDLNTIEGVDWFIKLPWWFKVETPLGEYNPDWAIVIKNEDDDETCYLVRETKGTNDRNKLRADERLKIDYGKHHFDAINVRYAWVDSAQDVLSVDA